MIRHTIHSMTVKRYIEMDATGNKKLACRFRFPFCDWAYNKLQEEVARLFDENFLENDILRVIMYNRIIMYRAAYYILKHEPENKELNNWYEENFYEKFKDTKRLEAEIERLTIRYKELEKDEPKSKKTFVNIVARVESILGYSIDRDMSIYSFKALYDLILTKKENG